MEKVWNHELCIIEEISKLMDRFFTCYLEYEIPLSDGQKCKNGKERHRLIVDIYASRNGEEVLVEVGTLSEREEGRLKLLKTLIPTAKVIHVHQWKNYGINEDTIWRAGIDWSRQINTLGRIIDHNLGNPWFSGCFNERECSEEVRTLFMNESAKRVGRALAKMG